MKEYIAESLKNSILLKEEILKDKEKIDLIETIGHICYNTIHLGYKILLCGNGGSAADSQHMAAELVGRFLKDRKALPAIALTTDTSILTAIANDYCFDDIFARQVEALGQPGDLVIGISTSGNSENVYRALIKANKLGIKTISFLGKSGGKCKDVSDYMFIVNSNESARIQEVHITIGHIICGIIDNFYE